MANETEIIIKGKDEASKVIGGITGALGSLGGMAKGALVAGLGIATAATGAFVAGLGYAIKEASAAQEIDVKLAQALANTGDVTGVTADMVNSLATEYMGLTRYEDDTIKSAATVIARFDNIGKDVFPQVMTTAMDLSTALGIDLNSAALMLGKALETPGEGLMRLKAAGVAFTDEQTAMIQKMAETGDAAGAQALILQALNDTVGGQAVAAGQTFAGQLDIIKNQFGDIAEGIGMQVLPMVQSLMAGLITFVSSDQFQTWVTNLTTWLTTYLPIAIQWVSTVFTTVLIPAITAVWTWMSTVLIPFLQNVVFPWLQTYIPIALQFLSDVWTTILLPAITAVWTWLSTVLIPFLQNTVFPWLQTNLPLAIQTLSDFWTNILKPAIEVVWKFIQDYIIPLITLIVTNYFVNFKTGLQQLADFWTNVLKPAIELVWNWISTVLVPFITGTVIPMLQDTFGSALSTLSDIWTNTLLPAITVVWDFINASVVPLLTTLADFISTVLGVALTVLAGLWQNVLLPAITAVWDFISASLNPIITTISDTLNTILGPAVTGATGFIDTLKGAFDGIGSAISGVIGWIQSMIDALNNIDLPDWLTPGSPTPFELGIRGISSAMKDMGKVSLPTLTSSVNEMGARTGAVYNEYKETKIDLHANYAYQAPEDVSETIKTLALVYGVS